MNQDLIRIRSAIAADTNRLTAGQFLAEAEIGHVYVINLVSRRDRRLKVARELARVDIRDVEFIDGIDGSTDPAAQTAWRAYREREPGQCASSAHISSEKQRHLKLSATFGTFGYVLAQRKVFEDAVKNGYGRICLFDDDVIFVDGYESTLGRATALLAHPWSVIQLGASEYSQPHPADEGANNRGYYSARPYDTCGSFATLYDRSIFAEVLDAIAEMDGPFDNVALGCVYARRPSQCHVLYPNVCAADVQSSSIRSPRDQFQHSERMRWPLSAERYAAFHAPHVVNIIFRDPEMLARMLQQPPAEGTDLIINGFCLTGDEDRPLQPHWSATHSQDIDVLRRRFDEVYADSAGDKILKRIVLPVSDLVVLWPSRTIPTRESICSCLLAECYGADRSPVMHLRARVVALDRLAVEQTDLASVIISTEKTYAHARAAIEAVIRQDHEYVELILVLDSSSLDIDAMSIQEEVMMLIRDKGSGRRRDFRVIRRGPTRYALGAQGTGLMSSRGEFVAFLQEEDRPDEGSLRINC